MTTSPMTPDVTRLDVRSILAGGGEPFDLIMRTAGQLPPGGALELVAPFEPVPLYAVMRQRGFARSTEQRGPAEWVVTFRDTGIGPEVTLSEVVARYPATAAVFTGHGMDLCCGGGKTIAFAAKAHGVDLDRLLEELQAAAG